MSTEKLRELKLYKKLERDIKYRQKLSQKLRQISSTQHSVNSSSKMSRGINKNKKYMIQQSRNLQIERQNRILLQKIHSQSLKNRIHRRSRQKVSHTINFAQQQQGVSGHYHNNSQSKIKQSRISLQQSEILLKKKIQTEPILEQSRFYPKDRNDTQSRNHQSRNHQSRNHQSRNYQQINNQQRNSQQRNIQQRNYINSRLTNNQETVLFQGITEIDQIRFKVKIVVKNNIYYLIGKNKHTDILLKMQLQQYRQFQKNVLKGNPTNIFQYLMIQKGQIKFRVQQQRLVNMDQIEQQQQQAQDLYRKYKQTKKKPLHQSTIQQMDVKQQLLLKMQGQDNPQSIYKNKQQLNNKGPFSKQLLSSSQPKLKLKKDLVYSKSQRIPEMMLNKQRRNPVQKDQTLGYNYQVLNHRKQHLYKLPYIWNNQSK